MATLARGDTVRTLGRQPTNAYALKPDERDCLVVSTITIDGRVQPLSTYGEDLWELPGAPTNTPLSHRRIDFAVIPACFRAAMKAMTFRYIHRGLSRNSKRPKTSTVRGFFWHASHFLKYLKNIGIDRLSAVTPFVCAQYVQKTKEDLTLLGTQSTRSHRDKRFRALEMIHELSQFTDDAMASHPWPHTSAGHLAGRDDTRENGRTPLIPDAVFARLFSAAYALVEDGDRLLSLEEAVKAEFRPPSTPNPSVRARARTNFLRERGWEHDSRAFSQAIADLRTACYVVIASLSGCRNHEIAFIRTGAYYSSKDEFGQTFWWMKSTSTKTGAGKTEWMIPRHAVLALEVMERWSRPYQAELEEEIAGLRENNLRNPQLAHAREHLGALFVGRDPRTKRVRTISLRSMSIALAGFTRRAGIDWAIATHQFRRTFAYYVARSALGDLRYLKEHFKHWSMDMTLLYALHEAMDEDLFYDIEDEMFSIKEEKVSAWMTEGTRLSGGTGRGFMEYRGSDPVVVFKTREQMIRTITANVELRSTGHSWCSAHEAVGCVGNGGLDKARCSNCEHSIIEEAHVEKWQGLYDHLRSLRACKDVGTAALERIERDLARCAQVLRDLGHRIVESEPDFA